MSTEAIFAYCAHCDQKYDHPENEPFICPTNSEHLADVVRSPAGRLWLRMEWFLHEYEVSNNRSKLWPDGAKRPTNLLFIILYATALYRLLGLPFQKWHAGRRAWIRMTWLVVLGLPLYICPEIGWLRILAIGFLFGAILDILLVNSATAFVRPNPRNTLRSLVLVVFSFAQIVIAFGILFGYTGIHASAQPDQTLHDPLLGIYFSAVTITTLGYGDFLPAPFLSRAFVLIELLVGFYFVATIVSSFVNRVKGGP